MLNPLDAFGPATNCLSLFTASMGESAKRSPCIAPYQDSSVEFCTSSAASVTGAHGLQLQVLECDWDARMLCSVPEGEAKSRTRVSLCQCPAWHTV